MASRPRVGELDALELWNTEDAVELDRPSDLKKYDITVASRDWTVETIVRQVEQGNIDLDPAFQRRNAWRDSRRSRLIESFVLGFPVPQLVLAENPRSRATFIAIDGKQRLLTIAGLYLHNYRTYWTMERFSGLEVLRHLNGVPLDEFLSSASWSKEQRQLANSDIRTTIITGFQDEDVLYDIFYRINTGSVPLSSQELRQVLNRGGFAEFLFEVTNQSNPIWKVLRINFPDPRLRDVELLLRLIALTLFAPKYKGDMKAFLDGTMRSLNQSWNQSKQEVKSLTSELFSGVNAGLEIFGSELGRKIRSNKVEHALNRALFEVQTYFLSLPRIRQVALQNKQPLVWTKRKRVTRATASILLAQSPPAAPNGPQVVFDILRTALGEAKTNISRAVNENNGISTRHLRSLFYPLGVDVPNDPVLIGSLELVIAIRHQWAHRSRFGATVPKSAKDAQNAVADCIKFAEKLAEAASALRP